MIQLVETEARNGQRYNLGDVDENLSCEAMQNSYSKDYASPSIFVQVRVMFRQNATDLRECVAIENNSADI